jgi:glycosyltransferase involved in cell wall biosynthesis
VRILYVATDQTVPGATGGSVHVLEVARGLARRGHEVHAVIAADGGRAREEDAGVVWHRVRWHPRHRLFRFRARPAVEAIADEVRPHVVMERYYNFGGEGVGTASRRGIPSLLEGELPVVDHPGSAKQALDAVLPRAAHARYRESLCRQAAALVSPIPEIVPEFAARKTETVTWGANVDAFSPDAARDDLRRELGIPEGALTVVFTGSFRPWHGVHVLERRPGNCATAPSSSSCSWAGRTRGRARDTAGRRLGTRPYAELPALVAAGDIGVAPTTPRASASSPSASTGRRSRSSSTWPRAFHRHHPAPPADRDRARRARKGLHAREGDPAALAEAIVRIAADPALRQRLGASARARVVERYSWARHCEQLERVLLRIAA